MRMFNRYYSRYDLLLLAGDIVLAALGTEAVRFVVVLMGFPEQPNWLLWMAQGGIVTLAAVGSFYCADLYAVDQTLSVRELLLRLVNGFGLICLVVAVVTYLFPALEFRKIHLPELVPVV